MKLFYLFSFVILFSCNSKQEHSAEKQVNENIFSKNLIVILKEDLDEKSNIINVQDYIENGKSFIPVFTSIDKFNESTRGSVENPKIEIQGVFLISILNDNDVLRLNPELNNEEYFNVKELKIKYSKEIIELNKELEKLNKSTNSQN